MSEPFFSIAIPAYKNTQHLTRLLKSIESQTFTDYEVIITDDTPDDSVEQLLTQDFPGNSFQYFKNQPALGTPENWNEAIRKAKGQWIKLMHNDDWFATPESLSELQLAVFEHPGVDFFFSAYKNIQEPSMREEDVQMNSFDRWFLNVSPLHLFRKVYVGNPSCTLVKNGLNIWYNKRLKFVVDFDYYIRLINAGCRYKYIDKVLLHIGLHESQVTQYTKYNPEVQIFENVELLRNYGTGILKNVFVFDYYWRLFRNIGVTSPQSAAEYLGGALPAPLKKLLSFQSLFPVKALKIGVVSKLLMLVAYLRHFITGG
jgi:glycosyltransferase involved in cell wall biosynthesis